MIEGGAIKIIIISVVACLKKSSMLNFGKGITVEKSLQHLYVSPFCLLESRMLDICNVQLLDMLYILVSQ